MNPRRLLALLLFALPFVLCARGALAAVDAELAKAVGGRDVTWAPADKMGTLEVPLSQDGSSPTIQVILGKGNIVTGILPIELRLKVDGVTYKTVHARWDVTVWETLPVLTVNLPAGATVQPANFELRRTALPAAGRGAILTPASMVGVIAKRSLTEGSLVTVSDVDRPTIVHEGEQLTLLVKKGTIEARVQVVAQGTASIGDRVRVKRLDAATELYAIVRSKELVELDLGV